MFPTTNTIDFNTSLMNKYLKNNDFDIFHSPTNSSIFSPMVQSSSSTDTSPESYPDLHRLPDRQDTPRPFGSPEHDIPFRIQESPSTPPLRSTRFPDQRQHTPFPFESPELDIPFRTQESPKTNFRSNRFYENQQFRSQELQEMPMFRSQEFLNTQIRERFDTPTVSMQPNFNQEPNIRLDGFPRQETPIRRRPIVGRNIMSTPPKETSAERPNTYELFPSETRGYEFRTPIKTSAQMSSPFPSPSSLPLSPTSPTNKLPTPLFKQPIFTPSTSFNKDGPAKLCTLCRKNGETPLVYMTHYVKEKIGNKNIVTCPILRAHVCSVCQATGDDAHTITYCPVLRSSNNGQPLRSTTITLKNTRVMSNGRRRY